MKIALDWVKDHINITLGAEELCKKLTASGLEVEGLEEVEQIKGSLEGVLVGEILTCEKHPDADKLSITTVDLGETVVPIVCGAPNVAKGQKVVVATTGTTLYPSPDESFKIKKAKIRGQVSEGMICAEDELGLGTSHDGIIVLDSSLKAGTPASEIFDISKNEIIEIGLTPNRADATSHFGVAREIQALTESSLKPAFDGHLDLSGTCPVDIEIENKEACPRYAGILIKDIKVGPSPDWLQDKLKSIDLSPINAVVDITNYILHDLGQPLHAFDADKIKGNKIIISNLKENTPFTTLDGVERKLFAEDLMICDGEETPLCIAGVFGGETSGVSDSTTSIFLESAYFSPNSVRKSSLKHGLKTDAAFRFERGTDPEMVLDGLKKAAKLITEIAGGKIEGGITDLYPNKIAPFIVAASVNRIQTLIGVDISEEIIINILESLDIKIVENENGRLLLEVPSYRVDVQREADIVEEVLRIYGFDNVPIDKNLNADYLAGNNNSNEKVINTVSDALVANGFYEIITNSLSKPSYTEVIGELEEKENVNILNRLSEDLGILRQSLLFTGLESLNRNINRRKPNLKLFEFGKTYHLVNEKYKEKRCLGIFMTGKSTEESWLSEAKDVNFYDLAKEISLLLEKLGISIQDKISTSSTILSSGLELQARKKTLVKLGAVKGELLQKAEIDQPVFFAEIDVDFLFKLINNNLEIEELSKFPEVRRDLSIVLDKSTSYEQVERVAKKTERKLLKSVNVFDTYEGGKLDSNQKSYSVSFILQDYNTLTDKVIDKTMLRLIGAFEKELKATIRR